MARSEATSIGIFLFEDAEELDWAGPWEVLSAWSMGWPDDNVKVFTVARERGPITCAKGLRVLADHTWEDAPDIDVLVYPGGRGTRSHIGDEAINRWLRGLTTRGPS